VSGLPVVDGRRRVLGVISASDVVAAIAEAGTADERERLFDTTRVREIMTARARVVDTQLDVGEAARQMLYLEIHRLFVVEDGELVGVISQSDIAGAVANAKL
jgi:CBS domain-containing protein